MARAYDTRGRRALAILAEGGPRKASILAAVVGEDTVSRLVADGRVRRINRRRGGVLIDLPKRKA